MKRKGVGRDQISGEEWMWESIDIYSRLDIVILTLKQMEGEASEERRSEQWLGYIKAYGDAYRKQQEDETVEAERL
jgi:hypothetical protein